MKKFLFMAALLAALLLTAGCGGAAQPEAATQPMPSPTQTPIPTPTPTPEPELPAGNIVTVDGTELASGSVIKNDVAYVKLSETAQALSLELAQREDGAVSFTWRSRTAELALDSDQLTLDGEARALAAPVIQYREELWLLVESVCEALDISLFYDEEYAHLYCTPAAGNWELPEGYKVPVFMYHAVTDAVWGAAELFSSPSQVDEQINYLLENGFDLIWFSDLEHIEDYDKPLILTFDDGYADNYTELFPILQKYNVKATFFIITNFLTGDDHNMSVEQVQELAASGLVDIQSHSYSHPELNRLAGKDQEFQLAQSKLDLVRITGKEPFVFYYPRGKENQTTRELVEEYYRFGVKMGGPIFCTGDDPTRVYRLYIKRGYGARALQDILSRHGYEMLPTV